MRDVIHVGHGLHIDPALGCGDHEVGPAEPQGRQQHHPGLETAVRGFPQEVLACHAQMSLAGMQLAGDVGGRRQPDLHFVETVQRGGVAPCPADGAQRKATVRQPVLDLLFQPPLGGDGDHQGSRRHRKAPAQARPGRTMQPTAPVARVAPSLAGRPS